MGSRGRKSGVSLVIPNVSPLDVVPRQRPPHGLTDEETEVWAAVVNVYPADWFNSANAPLLAQYCREVIGGKRLAEMIEAAGGKGDTPLDTYLKLLDAQRKASAVIASLATKMRISQQATTNHRGNKQTISGQNLWD